MNYSKRIDFYNGYLEYLYRKDKEGKVNLNSFQLIDSIDNILKELKNDLRKEKLKQIKKKINYMGRIKELKKEAKNYYKKIREIEDKIEEMKECA